MRFVANAGEDGEVRLGLLRAEEVFELDDTVTLRRLLETGGTALEDAAQRALAQPRRVLELEGCALGSPLPDPPTIRDFYAFERHVATARRSRGLEMEPLWYELPVFYFSNPYAVVGPEATVTAPEGSVELDFELEVALVVGKAGNSVSVGDASKHVSGFMVMNDWSARDLQRREMQLQMGPVKGKDFATSLGPVFVSADELEDFRSGSSYHLEMTASVNGVRYSTANLDELYWSFEEMVAYASRSTVIRPGDVLGSGTCGTGCILELALTHGSDRYPWLAPGDLVELEVQQLGTLANRVG